MLDSVRTAQDLWRTRVHIPEGLCEVLGDTTTHNSVRRKERKPTSRAAEENRGSVEIQPSGRGGYCDVVDAKRNQPSYGGGRELTERGRGKRGGTEPRHQRDTAKNCDLTSEQDKKDALQMLSLT